MPLAPGSRFGAYEIVSTLGAGGMGEVYRAGDSKLKRQVAIKVLPAALAGDHERLARFQREAEVLAALSHPHIAAIYGLEENEGVKGLVMELVEGSTLDEIITATKGSGLPIADVLAIARQIADALDAAHEQGIIHRDLKPANVKVRPDNTVKVLDFGLAKAVNPQTSQVSPNHSPTITTPAMTMTGIILGTAAYMSPEQARGRPVDKRTDIWAFGVVLYEMLTGRRAFEGEDVSLTLAAVMKSEPDLTALPPDLSAGARLCVARCLQKDPKQRLRDMGDVRLLLDAVIDTSGPATKTPAVAPRHWARRLATAALVVIVGAVMTLVGWYVKPQDPRLVTRFDHPLPVTLGFRASNRRLLSLSPDGRSIAYNASNGLYVYSLRDQSDRLVAAVDANASNPVFSPAGDWIAYWGSGQLKRIAITGGAPVVIATATNPYGLSWPLEKTIFFATPEGIYRVSADGGASELVIPVGKGEQFADPQLLPDGDTLVFGVYGTRASFSGSPVLRLMLADSAVGAHSLRTGQRTVLVPGGANPRYLASGHITFTVRDGLFALPFEPGTLQSRGGAVSMVEGVRLSVSGTGVGFASYDVARDGTLGYLSSDVGSLASRLVWVGRDGKTEPIGTIQPSTFNSPQLSADGKRVLVVSGGDARIYDLETGRETRVTSDRSVGNYAVWVPGEQAVTYSATRAGRGSGSMQVWRQSLTESTPPEQITTLDGLVHVDGWAPDGSAMVVHEHLANTSDYRTLTIPVTNGSVREPRLFTPEDGNEEGGVFSPDGRFVAYVSTVSGQPEVVIRPYPGPGPATPVSVGGGREPMWARSGELFYRRVADDKMIGVKVTTSPQLSVGSPVELFDGPGFPGGSTRASYAVTADGQRFIMSGARALRSGTTSNAPRQAINVVLNWQEELKERVPRR